MANFGSPQAVLHANDAQIAWEQPKASLANESVIREAAAQSGHMRILIEDTAGGAPGLIHVRDTRPPVSELARPAFTLSATTPVHEALTQVQNASEQLAIVMKDNQFIGVVTLSDILRRVLPPELITMQPTST